MTDIKNDDGLLPCDSNHILTATEKNLRKEVERLDALVSHYDALCERLSHENMVLKHHNPQPTEDVQKALDDIKSLYAKISPNDKPKPTLEDFGAVLYNHEQTIRNTLMKGAK